MVPPLAQGSFLELSVGVCSGPWGATNGTQLFLLLVLVMSVCLGEMPHPCGQFQCTAFMEVTD